MFFRVWTEGVLSGLDNLALVLALLVSVVMLISSWLVFWVAFRDGSPEQDDLAYYTRLVQRHLRVRRGYEDSAHQLEDQVELINRSTSRYLQQTTGSTGYPISRRALPAEPTAIESPPPISNGADRSGSTSD